MIGFRFRFKMPPDEPGDPKIFVSRIIFLVPGLLILGFGLWQGWQYFQLPAPTSSQAHGSWFGLNLMEMNLEPRHVAGTVAIVALAVAALFLWLAVSAELALRKSKEDHEFDPVQAHPSLFVSARKFTIVAVLVGYMFFFGIVLSAPLRRALPGMVVGFLYVASGGALCWTTLWLFRGGPAKPSSDGGPGGKAEIQKPEG